MKSKNMEMGGNCLLFALIVLIMFHYCEECSAHGGDTLSLGASLKGNQTIISQSGTFALGFFSRNGSNNWYIGIWYAKVAETIVWVANRETPAKKRPGVLKLSTQGGLKLFDAEGASLWSANMSNKASRALILDSGNFVVLSDGNKSEPAWQSFDHPTDTWLPGMKVGGTKKLVSWKNSLDPAPGLFSEQMDPSGIRQFVLRWNNSVQYWESGAWDGRRFSRIPEMTLKGSFRYTVENTTSSFHISYLPSPTLKVLTRFVVHKSGEYILYALFDNITWSVTWSQPRDPCIVYNICGAFGICNSNNVLLCSCVEGFTPADNRLWNSQDWSATGCVRQSPLNCHTENGSTDGFVASSVTLPEKLDIFEYPATTKKDCEKACLRNCSCTTYAFSPSSGLCKIWSGDLPTMRNSSSQSNSDVFIRLSASALAKFDHQRSSSKRRTTVSIVGAVLGIVGVLAIALCMYSYFVWRRYRERSMQMLAESSNPFLKMFSYRELKTATNNFRCKLGSGGFGSVFKGTLTDGTLVAVKKLEGSSGRDEKQFRAEINSLGSIQHVNLVRLRGFCAERSERLLVYEYMPNGSLNSLLFSGSSESKGKLLDWKTRFEIALGTARGILYLHEECRDRIIHCDVKPENILLDSDLSAKLADFGMAKLVGRDFSRVLTTMRGTRGYLAPEWLSGLPITPKVDVYSFGMTLLEIISGRRNVDTSLQDPNKHYFPSWAAAQIYEGNSDNIVKEYVAFAEEEDVEEVKRGVAVGLMCIEEDENVRPSMGQVMRMLEGQMEPPTPQISSDGDVSACDNVSGDPV